jgi:hypothetical protein
MKILLAILLGCLSAAGASTTYFDTISIGGATNTGAGVYFVSGSGRLDLFGPNTAPNQVGFSWYGTNYSSANALTSLMDLSTNGLTLNYGGFIGVGSLLTALNASSFSSGTVPAAQMPALTGDITSSAGAVATTLKTSPTIVTPTIASFVNSTHSHANAAGGGTLDAAAIASGTIAPARLGSGSGGSTKFLREDSTYQTISGGGDALVANPLSQFAATTSLQLLGVISDETGSGKAMFNISPTVETGLTVNGNIIATNSLGVGTNGASIHSTNVFQVAATGNRKAFEVTTAGLSFFGGRATFSTDVTNLGTVYNYGSGAGTEAYGNTAGTFTTTHTAPNATANRTITDPDATGTLALTSDITAAISDTAFASSWNGVTTIAPTKNAVYDQLHLMDVDDDGLVDRLDASVEIASTTDTTITRSAAGILAVEGVDIPTVSSTHTFTGKTFDASATGNVLKLKSYIYLKGFDNCTGALPLNTNDMTASTFMKPVFLNGTAASANYVEWQIQVPDDIDTSVDPKIRITDKLTAGDTGVRRYIASMNAVAASAAYAGTVSTAINVDIAGDASGASGDVEQSSLTTLTGWGAAVTAGRHWVIRIARDGNSGTDTSTVDSMLSMVAIEYGVTQ